MTGLIHDWIPCDSKFINIESRCTAKIFRLGLMRKSTSVTLFLLRGARYLGFRTEQRFEAVVNKYVNVAIACSYSNNHTTALHLETSDLLLRIESHNNTIQLFFHFDFRNISDRLTVCNSYIICCSYDAIERAGRQNETNSE